MATCSLFCVAMTELSESFKESMLDCKSRPVYEKWKERYENYKHDAGLQEGIGTFLDWLRNLSACSAVSTVWQAASCVNKFIKLNGGGNYVGDPVFKGKFYRVLFPIVTKF